MVIVDTNYLLVHTDCYLSAVKKNNKHLHNITISIISTTQAISTQHFAYWIQFLGQTKNISSICKEKKKRNHFEFIYF